jgi:hypothetical protein
VTAAFIQKYLTVIDLTSSETLEASDRLAMLAALIERLKGILHALDNIHVYEKSPGQALTSPEVELHSW